MRNILKLALLSIFSLQVHAVEKPNILIILTDDQGYSDAGCYGCKDFKTPHIDALASSGVRFTNGYVTHPYCSPSRAGILSGKYQQSFGHECNPPYDETSQIVGIDKNTLLMPSYFASAGYRSASFGKWHVGEGEPFRPVSRGFDHFWGFLGGGHDYFRANPKGTNYNSPIWIDKAPSDAKISYVTDDLTDAAIQFIKKENEQDKPFLIYLAYNAPHSPDQAKKEDLERVKHIEHKGRRTYAAMMTCVDDNVGRLTKTLEDLGIKDNTIIYYLSDNGGRRRLADSRPFRGNKGWLYEGGIRVPFIISYPNVIPKGLVYDAPVSSLDILSTSLAASGIAENTALSGKNLLPYLRGEIKEAPHKTLHWRVSGGAGYALRQGQWKLIKESFHTAPELYDLTADPEERNNLAKTNPAKLNELLALHQKWNSTLEKPRWNDGHVKGSKAEWNSSKDNGFRVYGGAWHLKK